MAGRVSLAIGLLAGMVAVVIGVLYGASAGFAGGKTDEELARFMIRDSKEILTWIVYQGVRWQPSLGGRSAWAGRIRSSSEAVAPC